MSSLLIDTGLGVSNSGTVADIVRRAAQAEAMGYDALWIPDVGGDVFGAVANLLTATSTAVVATGILNLWMHSADETAEQHASLTSQHGRRFLQVQFLRPLQLPGSLMIRFRTSMFLDPTAAMTSPTKPIQDPAIPRTMGRAGSRSTHYRMDPRLLPPLALVGAMAQMMSCTNGFPRYPPPVSSSGSELMQASTRSMAQ